MKKGIAFVLVALLAALALPMVVFSLDKEDAQTVGCLPKGEHETAANTCVSCHKDGQKRYTSNRHKACTTYCTSCHQKAEMRRHHTVGTELSEMPQGALHLTTEKKVACSTCHDLSQPRYEHVRWKASSLFDRMFRNESRYKTYFLAMRNNQGQLCLSCH